MAEISAVYLSATRKSSGKTTISIGLASAIASRDIAVQTFKKGPDYIDPMWLASASGRSCYNLDFYTQSHEEIRSLFQQSATQSAFSLIEGNKGLYDGVDLHGSDSNAALAALLGVPIVLVIDAAGMTRGVAPLVKGYTDFDDTVNIAGIILNNVGGSRHESKLRNVLEHYTDMKVLGAVQKDVDLNIDQRHLGLTTDREVEHSEKRIKVIRQAIERQVDVDQILQSKSVGSDESGRVLDVNPVPQSVKPVTKKQGIKIGIAKDEAFSFYYADDLDELKNSGIEVLFFDTLKDHAVPNVDALWIGGGFPETSAQALSENHAMRQAVKRFVDSGKPVYAECGGLMYLSRSIRWDDQVYPMVGGIPVDVEMQAKPVGRGYVQLVPTSNHPWFANAMNADQYTPEILKAHEFHYSRLVNIDSSVDFAYNVKRGYGVDGCCDGLVYGNIFAGYAHLRHTAQTPWLHWFLKCIEYTFSKAA